MLPLPQFGVLSALTTTLTSVLSALLLLALTRQLWSLRWSLTRDKESSLPLPKGSMGWPLVGETFHWLFQIKPGGLQCVLIIRLMMMYVEALGKLGKAPQILGQERHGNVFKTHLLGKPVIRVTGAENIRKILLGEHTLVCTQWPQSTRIILGPNTLILAKVFSRGALESYLPRLQDVVKSEIAKWCSEPGAIDVYGAAKALTFRIAVRVLLGLQMEEERTVYLAQIFEQLMNNLFSLPMDAPLSGLRKGIKAREILYANMEKIIEEKMARQHAEEEYHDAFDYIMLSSKEHGHQLSIQELKLLRHPEVVERARVELEAEGLGCESPSSPSPLPAVAMEKEEDTETTCLLNGGCQNHSDGFPYSQSHVPYLSLDKLSQLRYVDCVVKEVLRFLPPGYQIPKGWSVMYSIRDTHETAAVFQSPELFDPDRFGPDREEGRSARFSYVPFGGGVRSCVGKELAQIILKTLAVELIGTCKWTLATENFPKMQTVPIVHPVNGLHVHFANLRK
ncbi:hypothetical protein FQN60_014689 [Etheostoma spectabile]|uniref:Cytochrome P450 26C1 n=1 Tax=Etheostoma spectabile TaxID=54343 RepID=A0A5J5CVV9_9PERO|nr:hypothetical protein FQN60_014689 [Etheostoma spectabile]